MTATVYSEADVAAVLDMDRVIASQRKAFEALGSGQARVAPKVSLPNPSGSDVAISYLGRLSPSHGVVTKLVALHPDNAERGLPVISATVVVLDPVTGQQVAMLEATGLTEMRTAAGSAVAADALALESADELAVLGSGVQAKAHVRALSRVRTLREVRIFSRGPERREAAAAELSAELGLSVRAVPTAEKAVRAASVVATCTLSPDPVVATSALEPGTTVLAVGSFQPHRSEVDERLTAVAGGVVVDDVNTALEHAGPIIDGVGRGDLWREGVRSLGAVLLGNAAGRTSQDEVLFYNSVGMAVQDAAVAHEVLGTL